MAGLLRKFNRYGHSFNLARRVAAGITAAGFFLQPFVVQAADSNIVKADNDKANTISNTDGRYMILADQVTSDGKTAINEFDKFSLAEGNIANMYFGTAIDNAKAVNLVNLVNDHIDINGTVNAIQNHNIGGNLYFVSVYGMTVGSTGVINAGSINLIAPTKNAYNIIKTKDGNMGALAVGEVALNPQGTISVAGHLNAVDGITVQAANIELGPTAVLTTAPEVNFKDLVNIKDSQGNTLVDARLGNSLTATATGDGDIILAAAADANTTGANKTVDGEDWEETFDGFAPRYRTATVKAAEGSRIETSEAWGSYSADSATEWSNSKDAIVSKTDTSKGNVIITATATSEDEGWSSDNLPADIQTGIGAISNPLGQIVFTDAEIELNGIIKGNKITAASKSTNQYNSFNDSTSIQNLGGEIKGIGHLNQTLTKITTFTNLVKVDPIYSYMGSQAKLTVGANAQLTARATKSAQSDLDKMRAADELNPAVSLTAESMTKNIVQASVSSMDTKLIKPDPKDAKKENAKVGVREPGKAPNPQHLAAAAVSYNGTESNAEVTINGKVEAPGLVNVQAKSTDAMITKATANGQAVAFGGAPLVNAAVTVGTGFNDANVTIGEGAVVKSTTSDVELKSIAANSLDMVVNVKESTTAMGATAVADLTYESNAKLNIDGNVSGARYTIGVANNTTTRNNITASNSASGAPETTKPMTEEQQKNAGLTEAAAKDLLADEQKKTDGLKDSAKFKDLFCIGGSVAVVVENTNAEINIGNKANIGQTMNGTTQQVSQYVKLSSENNMGDLHMAALGGMTNANTKTASNAKLLVDASVLAAVVDNDASVHIADGEANVTDAGGKVKEQRHANILAGKVDINANSHQEYDRLMGIIDDLHKCYQDFENFVNDAAEFKKLSNADQTQAKDYVKQLGKCVTDLRSAVNKSTGLNIDDYSTNITTLPLSVTEIALKAISCISGVEQIFASVSQHGAYETKVVLTSLSTQLFMLATPENYANFIAASSVNTVTAGDNDTLGFAGAVNVNVLSNDANVYIGKYANVMGAASAANIESEASQTNVVMNGKPNVAFNPSFLVDTLSKAIQHPIDTYKGFKAEDLANIKKIITFTGTDEAPLSVGGTLGVAQHNTTSDITVADHAAITGTDAAKQVDTGKKDGDTPIMERVETAGVTLHSKNQNITTDLSYSAGKAGKVGFEGLFAWMGGNVSNTITVADSAALTSKAQTSDANTTTKGINILGETNVIGTNIVGSVAWSSGAASVGMSDGMTYYDIDNIVNVGGTLASGAKDINVNALTDGVINTITLAGSMTSTKEADSKAQSAGDTLEQENVPKENVPKEEGQNPPAQEEDKTVKDLADHADKKTEETQNQANKDVNEVSTKKTEDTNGGGGTHQGQFGETQAPGGVGANGSQGATNKPSTPSAAPSLHIAGAGSASVNIINATTEAKLSNAKVVKTDGANIATKAEDATFVGGWSGAAAMNWKQSSATKVEDKTKQTLNNQETNPGGGEPLIEQNKGENPKPKTDEGKAKTSGYNVALAGAAAINSAIQRVSSEVSNLTVEADSDLNRLTNVAQKDGAMVAAGLAVSVSKDTAASSNANFAGAASASVNVVQADIDAKLSGVKVVKHATEGGHVANYAFDSDTQVTGGVNATLMKGGKLGVGAGGTLSIAELHNDVKATAENLTLKGTPENTNYKGFTSFYNNALTDITQVTAALGTSTSAGAKTGVAFNAAIAGAFNQNDVKAVVKGSSIEAELFTNEAADADKLSKPFSQVIEDYGMDSTGASYFDYAETNAATDKNGEKHLTIQPNEKKSSVIVTVAADLAASFSEGGVVGAGAGAVSVIDNDRKASVKDSTITAGTFEENAFSDTVLINAAGGMGVSGGTFSGAGSVSVQSTQNDVLATVEDSTIAVTGKKIQLDTITFNPLKNTYVTTTEMTAGDMKVHARTNDIDVNAAGQISVGQNGGGLALAFNHLSNQTEAKLRGSWLDMYDGIGGGVNSRTPLSVTAENNGTVVSVAAGVSAGSTSAVQGAFAVNQGRDNVLSIVEKSDKSVETQINQAESIEITATDNGTKVAVAGGISGAGTAAVGGSVAYNEIGTWRADDDETEENEHKQLVKASMRQTFINGGSNSPVRVTATDNQTLGTAAAGIGGAGSAAVEGASANSVIVREVKAEALASDMYVQGTQDKASSLAVTSTASGEIYNNAIVLAGSGAASFGAGVGVNYDGTEVSAKVSGGTYKVTDLDIEAKSQGKILTTGVGGAGAGNAGIAGSVSVSVQTGDTVAQLGDEKESDGVTLVDSSGSAVVAAQSDRAIDNIAGTAAFGGVGAGVAATITVSDIQGSTKAIVDGKDTSVTTAGGKSHKLSDRVKDDTIIDNYVNDTNNAAPTEYMERKDTTYYGIVVSSSATNKISSYAVNAAGTAEGGAVAGNINVSTIGGNTEATVKGSKFDAGADDINVVANDYANNSAFVGSANFSGIGGNGGIASSTLTISRGAAATFEGSSAAATAKAGNINVLADSEYGIGGISFSYAVNGVGAALGNVDNITLLSGTTSAAAKSLTMDITKDLSVSADRWTSIHTVGISGAVAGISGAVGLGVDVVKDQSTTEAWLTDSTVHTNGDDDIKVHAKNSTDDNYQMHAVNAGAGGISGTVSVGNFDSIVQAKVLNSTIGSDAHRAGNVMIEAGNLTKVTPKNWSAGAGGLGVGVGVQVATLGTTTSAGIGRASDALTGSSTIYSKDDITVRANEDREADLLLGNTVIGGTVGGVNVGVITVNGKVKDAYSYTQTNGDGTTEDKKSPADLKTAYQEADKALASGNMKDAYAFGYYKAPSITTAGRGGKEGSVATDLSNSTINTTGSVKAEASDISNITEKSIGIAAGGCGMSASVGVLDVTNDTSLKAANANITAGGDITLKNTTGGFSDLEVHIGAAEVAGGAGAIAIVDAVNNNVMNISGSTVKSTGGDISMTALDNSSTEVFSVAAQGSLLAGAVQVAEIDMGGETSIALGDNDIEATGKDKSIKVSAKNAPKAVAKAGAVELSFFGQIGVGVVNAGIGSADKALMTSVTATGSNKFVAPTVSIKAGADITEDAKLEALAGALAGEIMTEVSTAKAYSNVTTDVAQSTFGANDMEASLDIGGSNTLHQTAKTAGVELSELFTVSNNFADTTNVLNTTVNASGATKDSKLKSASIISDTTAVVDASSQSYGGAEGFSEGAGVTHDSLTTNTQTKVGGKWTLSGDFTAQSHNKEKLTLNADTSNAALIEASGAGIDSTVTQNAAVNLVGSSDKTAEVHTGGSQSYYASNTMDSDSSRIETSGLGGLAEVGSSRLYHDRSYNAAIGMENSIVETGGALSAEASTKGRTSVDNYLSGTGLLEITTAFTNLTTTQDNQVNVKNSALSSKLHAAGHTGDALTLAAHEDTELSVKTVADNQFGVGGAAVTNLSSTLNRSNLVKVQGSSTLTGGGDLNLYAGRSALGEQSSTGFSALSDVYNRTIIPFANRPLLDTNMTQKNKVITEAGTSGTAVGDVNIVADKAHEYTDVNSRVFTMWSGHDDKEVSTSEGSSYTFIKTSDNVAELNGKLQAGHRNSATIEIGGTVGKNDDGSPNFDGVTFTFSDGSGLTKNDFSMGTKKLENGCWEQYESLTKMLAQYSPDSAEYQSYQEALNNLVLGMMLQGFAGEVPVVDNDNKPVTDADGNPKTHIVVYHYIDVPAIELPELTASGGNVNVNADALKVTDSLQAQGTPSISVTNRTPLYLVVNGVVISHPGGRVFYNNRDISQKVEKAEAVAGITGIDKIHADATAAGKTSLIDISATAEKQNVDNDSLYPLDPVIDIRGDVINTGGNVSISNAYSSIYVEGSATVSGNNVSISSPNGKVVQNNPTGVYNVGYDPILHYMVDDVTADTIQKKLHNAMNPIHPNPVFPWNCNSYDDFKTWVKSTTMYDMPAETEIKEGAGIHAGEVVYINAHEVNLDGVVQSGYSSYTAKLDDASQAVITQLDKEWLESGVMYENSQIRGNEKFLVNGGAKDIYDSETKTWKANVGVYYNPSTKELLVDSIKAEGGQVYISGNVSSTGTATSKDADGNVTVGKGSIMAADGAAEISIDTTGMHSTADPAGLIQLTPATVLSTIENSNRNGFVRISDNLTGKIYEYKNGSAKSYDFGKPELITEISANEDNTYTFNPKENIAYQWTGGVTEGTRTDKTYTDERWFGIHFESPTQIKNEVSETDIHSTVVSSNNDALDTSSFVKTLDKAQEGLFTINGQWINQGHSESEMETVENEHLIWGVIHTTYTYNWSEYDQYSSSTTYSLKADNPVSVKFLTSADNSIKVNADGNLKVGGSVTSADSTARVTLTSKDGSISGGGIIHSDILDASGYDISLQHAALDADHTAQLALKADKGIEVNSAQGHVALETGGRTSAGALKSVDIAAQGNITNAGSSVVQADKINLTSTGGSIGTADAALRIKAGGDAAEAGLSAKAEGDIRIEQTSGNLYIGTISSSDGSVALKTDAGSIIGVNDSRSEVNTPERQSAWASAGLISGTDDNSSAAAAAEAKTKRTGLIEKSFTQLAGGDSAKVAAYKQKAQEYTENELLQEARTAYINARKNALTEADIEKADNDYKAAQAKFFEGSGYTKNEQKVIAAWSELSRGDTKYGWSKNQLLYALQTRVLNSKAGDMVAADTADITAKNVSLEAVGGGIGMNGETVTIPKDELRNNIKLLTQAGPGDLAWNEDGSVTMRQKRTVNVDAENGVTLKSAEHTYIGSIEGKELIINGDAGTSGYDTILLAGNGITQTSGSITAKDLTAYAGNGSVGSEGQALELNMNGALIANAGESVNIHQDEGSLSLSAVIAGKDIRVNTKNDILMSDINNSVGYLSAGNDILLSSTDGNMGAAGAELRIKNDGSRVNADAQKGTVYLTGTGGSGYYVLGDVTAKGLYASNENGNILSEKQSEAMTSPIKGAAVTADRIELSGQNISLSGGSYKSSDDMRYNAAEMLVLTDSVIDSGKNIEFTAGRSITQENTAVSSIHADGAVTFQTGASDMAGGSIEIVSDANTFEKARVRAADKDKGIEGTVDIVSTAANGLTVDFGAGSSDGSSLHVLGADDTERLLDVTVRNLAEGSDLTITGGLTAKNTGMVFASSGSLHIGTKDKAAQLADGKRLMLTAKSDITANSALMAAGDIIIKSSEGGVSLKTTTVSTGGGVAITAAKDFEALTGITAKNDVVMTSTDGSLTLGAEVTSTDKGLTLVAEKDIKALVGVDVAGDIEMNAKGGSISLTNALASKNGSIALVSKENLNANVTTTAAENITMGSTEGSITLASAAETKNGDLTLIAHENIDVNADITAEQGTVTAQAGKTLSFAEGTTVKTKSLAAQSGSELFAGGALTLSEGANLTSKEVQLSGSLNAQTAALYGEHSSITGNAAVSGILYATGTQEVRLTGTVNAGELKLESAKGDILAGDAVSANDISAVAAGNIGYGSDIAAQTAAMSAGGNITITGEVNTQGDLYLDAGKVLDIEKGEAKAGGDLTLGAGEGTLLLTKAESGGNAQLYNRQGDISADTVTTKQTLSVQAGGGLAMNETASGGDMSLSSGRDMTLGNVKAGGSLTADAGGTMQLITAESGGNASLTAKKSLELDTLQSKGGAVLTAGDGGITAATLAEAGKALILSSGAQLNASALQAGGILSAEAQGNADIKTANAGGALSVKSSQGSITAEVLNSEAAGVTLRTDTGTITADSVNAAGRAVLKTGSGNITAGNVSAAGIDLTNERGGSINAGNLSSRGETLIVAHGSGDIEVDRMLTNGLNLIHQGTGRIAVKDADIRTDAAVLHMGDGDISLGTVRVGDEIYVSQLGTGSMYIDSLTAGQKASLKVKNGNMELGTIDGGNRLVIMNYGRPGQAMTKADTVSANELFTLYAFDREIGTIDSPLFLDVIFAGDEIREAVGWRGAENAWRMQEAEEYLGGSYTSRYDLLRLGSLYDFYPWSISLPQDATAGKIIVEEDENEELLKALS